MKKNHMLWFITTGTFLSRWKCSTIQSCIFPKWLLTKSLLYSGYLYLNHGGQTLPNTLLLSPTPRFSDLPPSLHYVTNFTFCNFTNFSTNPSKPQSLICFTGLTFFKRIKDQRSFSNSSPLTFLSLSKIRLKKWSRISRENRLWHHRHKKWSKGCQKKSKKNAILTEMSTEAFV